ncbi:adenylate/guanylate cyclase domain-containing protein [Tersicoccus sp. Bi-70]|uniref:adenylate/guanylate cyclase domain-containing protein n=1 Tax=Tersicoccus sp. Bi-70 TaxID=1897634 RepID=UPI0009FA5843|nr:adenylate/guanylate cyclase domain-containing protein [Tersicoccus sp. Bi-70]
MPLTTELPRIGPRQATSIEASILGGDHQLSRRQIAQEAGVSLKWARQLWRAMGFANVSESAVAFTERDLEALRTATSLVRDGRLSEEATISIARAFGQMTDRMVIWQIEAIVEDMVDQLGISDTEARERLIAELPTMIEPLQELLSYAWRRQLNEGVQRLAVRTESQRRWASGGRHPARGETELPIARAVGFADLVSYTSLSRRMNERTLASLVTTFEARCAEIISVGGGRMVKTVGDEVLYIADTPQAGAEIALALATRFADDPDMPATRGSVVWGRILPRLGDVYGPTVNMASRLTSIADAGTVLTDQSTARMLASNDTFVLTPQPTANLRGFGEVHPVLLTRGQGSGLVVD